MLFHAGCKININLLITGRDANGYHLLRSIFFPLSNPADELEINPEPPGVFKLECDRNFSGPNILEKTWLGFCETCGCKPGVTIKLTKKIPSGAGLGGGSSDAALLLRWLNQTLPGSLKESALLQLAKSIGADVPFFIYNKPALVSGIGEQIHPLSSWPGFYALVVWPELSLSTADIFREWDRQNPVAPESLTNSCHADKKKCACGQLANICNDLEPCAIRLYPQLELLRSRLQDTGAWATGMSGSGSSFFGLYWQQEAAKNALAQLSVHYRSVFLNRIAAKR